MISVYNLEDLSPEEYRAYDLQKLVGNRFILHPYTAKELHELWKESFDYTLEEIQEAVNKRGTK